jgi:hypothetical protein
MVVIIVIGLTTLPLRNAIVSGDAETTQVGVRTNPIIIKILKNLRPCESSSLDSAINPKDLDNTASYGRYQMKPGTMLEWGIEYKFLTNIEPTEIMNLIMDGELQEAILIKVLEDNWKSRDFWEHQFPACSAKYRFWEYN